MSDYTLGLVAGTSGLAAMMCLTNSFDPIFGRWPTFVVMLVVWSFCVTHHTWRQ